jgi:hypothetical protein
MARSRGMRALRRAGSFARLYPLQGSDFSEGRVAPSDFGRLYGAGTGHEARGSVFGDGVTRQVVVVVVVEDAVDAMYALAIVRRRLFLALGERGWAACRTS